MTGQYSLALEHLKATRIWLIKSLPEELQEVFKKKKVQEFSSALDAHKLSEFDSHTTWLFRCICMTSEQILDCHLQLREDKSIKKPYYLIWQMHKISSCLTHHTAILAHAENAIYTSNFCLAFDKEKLAKVYLRSAGFILKDFSLEECPDLKCRYYTLRGIILIESNGTKDSISKASKLARSASKALEVYHDQIQYIDTNLEELLQGLRLKIAIRENDLYDSVESRSNLIDTINTLIPEGDVTSNTPSLQLIYLHGILASVYDKVYLSDKADEHRAIAEQYERDYTINNIG